MDANDIKAGGDGEGRRSKHLHTSDITMSPSQIHNGHNSSINLSYQIVLQDHNYGAPLPPPNSESMAASATQCKQEPLEVLPPSATYVPVTHQQRVGLKTLPVRQGPLATSPQQNKGGSAKANGTNFPVNKRQRTSSGTQHTSNGVSSNHVNNNATVVATTPVPRKSYDTAKTNASSNSVAPPLVLPKQGMPQFSFGNLQGPGDLNSHLYASVSNEKLNIKDEKANGGLIGGSSYLNNTKGWFRNNERTRSRSELRDSFNDDSNESLDSPHMATESDREGEETETAPECEGEEDDYEEQHEESVTRCICKFGHDDGYMICCDRCSVWQHVECMNLDRNNIPEEYLCEMCQPRRVDRARARAVQYRKRQEFRLSTPPPAGRENRRGDSHARSKDRVHKEEYIDVEKTPKKVCRNNTSGPKSSRGSVASSATAASRNALRGEGHKTGKRGGHQKWKRKLDKVDDMETKDRLTRKRKIFRSKSASETVDLGGTSVAENSSSARGSSSGSELMLQWIDHYEEAVTNHYSPELRARVAAIRPNGLFNGSLSPPSDPPTFRLASKAGGFKTLVASAPIVAGTSVIECRGKYMLSSQLRPYKSGGDSSGSSGSGGLRPTPHILFHHLPTSSGENSSPAPMVEMCVDGRSYGNEARFAWQSCQPNAEVKHVVEKGSIHLYLVAKMEILESEEITIAHDVKNPLPCPYEGCPHMSNRDAGRTGLTSSSTNPVTHEVDRKRRRRRTNSTAASDPPVAPVSPVAPQTAPSTAFSSSEHSPVAAATAVTPPATNAPPATPVKRQYRTPSKSVPEGEDSIDGVANHFDDVDGQAEQDAASHGKRKLSREERKMEAIMKAFERLEKAEQRRQEALARMAHRKDGKDSKDEDCLGLEADVERSSSPTPSSNNVLADKKDLSAYEAKSKNFRRGVTMKRRGGGTRLRRTSSGAGIGGGSTGPRNRMRALSGEVHSGHSATEGEESEHGGNYSPGQGSNAGTPADESRGLAQVMAFKCPKTKKVVFNDWSTEGGESNGGKADLNDLSGSNPLSLSVPMCYMRNPNPRSPTRPIRTAHLRPSTLASLKTTAGSGSPDPHADGLQPNDENLWAAPMAGSAGGSAKKRWLRQAISEETETELPGSNGATITGSSSCGNGPVPVSVPVNPTTEVLDHVTPLKKRRLARASLSSETSFTPPSTPTPTQERTVGSTDGCGESMTVQSGTGPSAISDQADKGESLNVESLSAENSQSTSPQRDEPEVMDHRKSPRSSPVVLIEAFSNDSLEKDQKCATLNGFTNDPSWSSERSMADLDGNGCIYNVERSGYLSVEAASLLSLRHAAVDESYVSSPSRPTWEFRAPDAQFLRNRGSNEVSNAAGDSSPTDSSQLSPAEGRPKPAKKKLSILEYRQRKQNLTNDGTDVSKEESSPSVTMATDSISHDSTTGRDQMEPGRQKSPEHRSSESGPDSLGEVATADDCSSSSEGSSKVSDPDVEMSVV